MSNNPSVRTFTATALLYAVMEEDMEEARRIVADMPPVERAEAANQLDTARSLLADRFGYFV